MSSSLSVSTISTNASKSPARRRESADGMISSETAPQARRDTLNGDNSMKRRRRTSSVSSTDAERLDRNTRHRRRSTSPAERGRTQDRSHATSHINPATRYTVADDLSTMNGNGAPTPHMDEHAQKAGNRHNDEREREGNGGHHGRGPPAARGWSGHGNDMRSPARYQERSLSPYSKRIALSRAANNDAR